MSRWVATLGPVGYLKPAPGTWGSLFALGLGCLLAWGLGPWAFIAATVLSVPLGVWAIDQATKGRLDHDPSEIVIDELSGQWIALLPVIVGAAYVGANLWQLWPGILVAFVGFRVFDIWKPGPVGWADRKTDALGVMLDDVIAGIFAAVCVVGLAAIAHLGVLL